KRNMERARALDTANFSVYYHLGEIYMKLGFTSEAFTMLQKSIELNGHYTPSRTNIGMVLVRLNRHDEAKMHLMKALELNPEIGAAHDALGMSYLELKNPEQALSHFSSAAAL